ncbi:DinB superfamily protein [Flavobacterium swingsii]|uniref:DinB superfamily protein n=1 Tax=Flavobacterium swingsii TaxID=498292 RepID=A0A1I0ZQM7_9FLAO|nr:DinB family protein [Flavobacterium swingsii]SFB27857.1 DinB superfamily protein [Flavobacterium swingsii]
MKNLLESDYPAYFGTYINHVQNDDCIAVMEENLSDFVTFIENISVEKYNYKYQEDKWTIKDIVRHIIDAERIFAYRALRFARFDRTPIPGFEENDYAANVNTTTIEMADLLQEFILVRKSTIKLFESFTEDMLVAKGIASGKEISVLALGFIISGHAIHHQNVIRERYL